MYILLLDYRYIRLVKKYGLDISQPGSNRGFSSYLDSNRLVHLAHNYHR
jgi:hypothetical protein